MADFYMTDHGAVKISPKEAEILTVAKQFRRRWAACLVPSPQMRRVFALETSIAAACRRFAEFNSGR